MALSLFKMVLLILSVKYLTILNAQFEASDNLTISAVVLSEVEKRMN